MHLIPENAAYRGSSLGFGKAKKLFGTFREKSALLYAAHMLANTADHLAIHTCILYTCTLHNEYVFPKLKRALSLFPHIVFIHTNLVQAHESKLWDDAGCWFVFGTRSVPQTSLHVCSSPELVPPPACGSSRLDSASGSGSDTTIWWASCDWGPPGNLKGVMGEF